MEQWWNNTDRGKREWSNGGMIVTAEHRENGAMVE